MTHLSSKPSTRENVPLAPFTTLGVGGPARYLVEARTEDEVRDSLAFASRQQLPVFVLGGGSNVLFSDAGYPGLILQIALRGIHATDQGSRRLVAAAAGENWDSFVSGCVENDLSGIECLSGIPGTVGGTPVQNVGAYGAEAGHSIVSVQVLDRESLATLELGNADCRFGYRSSIFNTTQRDRYIVLGVTYALTPGGRAHVDYPDLHRIFGESPATVSLREIRKAVLEIRAAKSMLLREGDPNCRSAGSFFKNPIITETAAHHIEDACRQHGMLTATEVLPRYAAPEGRVKLSAAWLIEKADFPKGYIHGRAGLSTKHSLAIINRGGATAGEVIDLAHEIQERIHHTFGIELQPEPVLVGF